MAKIDIPVGPELQEMLNLPSCADLNFPQPQKLKVTLPNGASLTALNDLSRGIPTDCSLTFSLMLQLAPFLAAMDCLLKILALIKPLIDIIKGLPFPPLSAIKDFIKAAADVSKCFLMFANIPFFIKDVLCVILKALRCLISQLKVIRQVMSGLSVQMQLAQDTGNLELMNALQCAQDNANKSALSTMQSIEPITALLALLAPIMGFAKQPEIKLSLPAVGSSADVAALSAMIDALTQAADAIQIATDAMGGCD